MRPNHSALSTARYRAYAQTYQQAAMETKSDVVNCLVFISDQCCAVNLHFTLVSDWPIKVLNRVSGTSQYLI